MTSLACLLASGPAPASVQKGDAAARALVEPQRLDASICLDIRYATADNFVHRPVYPVARALLKREAAEALVRVHRALAADGFGIVIFDAYRPWSVTRLFWDLTPPDKRAFVADPAKGSQHNRACAVDITLYERATGRPVVMPSEYDEMSARSAPDYMGGDAAARARRDLLIQAMRREGFKVYESEWWHFEHGACREAPLLDVPLERVPSAER
jgi:D-alanyl-D-alanine dipeptidase